MTALVVIGASFRTAPIEVRERLALTSARNRCLVGGVTQAGDADEAIAVSTCNRTELYLVGADATRVAELGLAELRAIAGEHDLLADSAFFIHHGEHAAQHAYRVAAGLDAIVKGEAEVLGQVRESLALARIERSAGPILSRLFESAIETARRVRNETAVGRTAVSVGSIAAGLAEQTLGRLDGAAVLVIGAGETAELVVTSLVARGAESVRVVNRTVARALELAERFGGVAGTMDRLEQEVAAADVVVSATHAPHHLVTPELVGDRTGRPLLAIDLAVPRDIDPGVRALPGVALYDIDALESVLARNRSAREGEAVAGEEIVAVRAAEFQRWLMSLDVVPAITGLRALAEEIRREELDRVVGRFENLTPRDRAVLEQLTRSIVNKLLHEPTIRMKDGPEFAQTVRALFDLGPH
jgi:glutamyl-tRNA reductase